MVFYIMMSIGGLMANKRTRVIMLGSALISFVFSANLSALPSKCENDLKELTRDVLFASPGRDKIQIDEYLRQFYGIDLASMSLKRFVQKAPEDEPERSLLAAGISGLQFQLQREMATASGGSLMRVKWTPEQLNELQYLVKGTSRYLSLSGVPHEIYASREHPELQILRILPGDGHKLNKLSKGLLNKFNTTLIVDFFRTATVASAGAVKSFADGELMILTPEELETIKDGVVSHEVRHVLINSSKLPYKWNILKTEFRGNFPRIVGKDASYQKHFRLDELYAYQTNIRDSYHKLRDYALFSSAIASAANLALNARIVADRVLDQFSRPEGLKVESTTQNGNPAFRLTVEREVELVIPVSALNLPPNTLFTKESAPLVLKAIETAVKRMQKYSAATSAHIGLIKAQSATYIKLRQRWRREGQPQALEQPMKQALEGLNRLTVPTRWPQPD